jgi:hypothetical protein
LQMQIDGQRQLNEQLEVRYWNYLCK